MSEINATEFIQFIDVGVVGLVLAWFMTRAEKRIDRQAVTNEILARAITRLVALSEHQSGHSEGDIADKLESDLRANH